MPDVLKHSFFNPDPARQAGAQQGASVAGGGNFVVAGAPYDDIGGFDAGLAKIYHAATGALLHTIPNPAPTQSDYFGNAAAISGSRAVIGAHGSDVGGEDRGRVYVYDLSSSTHTGDDMRATTRIGLIGDYDASVPAHLAIPIALRLAGDELGISVEYEWVPTEEIVDKRRVSDFHGLWCVPASPYRNMAGALTAIQFARENRRPFLGTCGGFQHAIIEYARNVLGWTDAEHAETAPEAMRPVITPLACELAETTENVRFRTGSQIAACYGREESAECYRCRYGLSPEYQAALVSGPLRAGAEDATGEIRAVELDGHPFFLATLFQLERLALKGQLPPVVLAFVRASIECAARR